MRRWMNGSLAFVFAITLLGGFACNTMNKHAADDDKDEAQSEPMAIAALPANVKAAFEKAYPGATIKEVEKETYTDGSIHYEIEFATSDGKQSEVEIDSGGDVLPEH